jgi:O-antigen ligase
LSVAAEQTLDHSEAPAVRLGPLALWGAGLVGLVAAVAAGTYAGYESSVVALLIASLFLAMVVSRPQIGVMLIIMNYLVASYPTPLRGEGLLTINNLLGILLAVIMIADLVQKPDFWFLKVRQVHVWMAIGLVFAVSTLVASYKFPDLAVTRGTKGRLLDQTGVFARDYITRLAFVVLCCKFLVRRKDLTSTVWLMMICLLMVVPSALWGFFTTGGRAAAQFSIGTNANRLAFLCLMQTAFWFYWARTQSKPFWRAVAYAAMGSLVLTVFLTASRSGVLGFGFLVFLLTRSRGGMKGGRLQALALVLLGIGVVFTVLPEESVERLGNLNPFATRETRAVGAYSTERRVATVERAWQIFLDHPFMGIGPGNFRQVALQVYSDPFYRSPHNSIVWALSEGGIFFFLLFLVLFWFAWKDIRWLQRSPATPPELRWIATALEPSLLLLLFYSFFADMWLNPITYILIIITILFRHYVSSRRVVVV